MNSDHQNSKLLLDKIDNKDIAELDANLKTEEVTGEKDLVFTNVCKKPFDIYGLYQPTMPGAFCRMPLEEADAVSPGVSWLSRNTAGGRVRFSTDSCRIVIRATIPAVCKFPHMPLTGSCGFDLYETVEGKTTYIHTFVPPMDLEGRFSSEVVFSEKKRRYFTLHFPLYSPVSRLKIGVEQGTQLKPGLPYHWSKPVVFYGSSITQGGCASRPGNAYQAVMSRKYDFDFMNLGFSGNAKGEKAMAEYLAGLEMSVFVCDYDHNAPHAEHLKNTLEPLIQVVRTAQPQLPIVMISKPDFHPDSLDDVRRREIIRDVYDRAVKGGDSYIRFIDGETLFEGENRDACTVDGCHPNDLGMIRMAQVIGPVVRECLEA